MMLTADKDLERGYEIIPPQGQSTNKRFRKIRPFTKTSVRNLINNPLSPEKDVRLQERVSSVKEVTKFIEKSLSLLGYSQIEAPQHLEEVAAVFFDKYEQKSVKCRMELVTSDKCRSFHADYVFLRAITTLVGPGTEYISLNNPDEIHRVETGHTILLPGKKFPSYEENILHKSPKISHLNICRLVLVIDC